MRRQEVFRDVSVSSAATKPGVHEKTWDIFLLCISHEMPAVFKPKQDLFLTLTPGEFVPEHLHRCHKMKLMVNQKKQILNNHC